MNFKKYINKSEQSTPEDMVAIPGYGLMRRDQAHMEAIRKLKEISEAIEQNREIPPSWFDMAKDFYLAYIKK